MPSQARCNEQMTRSWNTKGTWYSISMSNQTIEITWDWNSIPSKKNSKQLRVNRKTGARFISSSDSYHKWEEWFVKDVQSLGYTIGKCKRMEMEIYAPNRRLFDLSNKFESVADWLVKAWFLEDDNYTCIPEITLKFGGIAEDKKWRVKIKIEV